MCDDISWSKMGVGKLIQSRARLKTEQILFRPWRIWPQSSFFLRHECNWHHNGMADVVKSHRLLWKRSTWFKRHWFATWPEGKFEIRSGINLPPGSHCTWRVNGPSGYSGTSSLRCSERSGLFCVFQSQSMARSQRWEGLRSWDRTLHALASGTIEKTRRPKRTFR